AVLALYRGGIRNLGTVTPPEADREQLSFSLQVITHEQLGTVADVIVHSGGPLRVVLVEDFRLNVIVATGHVGLSVGGGIQLQQGERVRIKVRLRNDAAWKLI